MVGALLKALYFLSVSSVAFSQTASTLPTLSFHVLDGENDNYFLRDDVTSAQLLLTASHITQPVRRVVMGLPAGNSGALTYFLPLVNTDSLSVTVVNGTLQSATEAYNNVGAQADLHFSGNATMGATVIGAVRAMRDSIKPGVFHEIFNYTLNEYNATSVRLHRQNINQTIDPVTGGLVYKGADLYMSIPSGSDAQLSVTPSNNGSYTPATINILVPPGATNPTLRIRVVTNETSLVGLDPQQLFLETSQATTPAIKTALQGLNDGSNFAATETSFLTYKDKFLAGGWRFLTYFGRDTMIATRLLMPVLSADAIEAALGAVIERANSTGALAHEETIGDYASYLNILHGDYDYGAKPWYDYKMIDTDVFLLPALSHYFLELPQGKGRSAAFLAKKAILQEGTYGEILNRISNYNFGHALPFYHDPVYSKLLEYRSYSPVGNWRDSLQGTGYGRIPFDVNSALVPASLRAAESLIANGILEAPTVTDNRGKPIDIGDVASFWERKAAAIFEVAVDPTTAEARLEDFIQKTNLSQALLEGNRPQSDVKFYALALRTDGTPVEVMHSDTCFNLLYGTNVSREFLQLVVNQLTPYPRGLLTNIGMLIANPGYDSNRTNIAVLDRGAYHGTTVWSFQHGIMASGLARQLSFCSPNDTSNVDIYTPPVSPPAWCSDTRFVQSIKDAQTRLWASIRGAAEEIYSEVWSWSYDNATNQFAIQDLASLSPDGTESDAIQLWSYGFLGILDPSGQRVGGQHVL
ncbi:hypothetical protein AX17_002570 [Amanita inopinata Kibby_2008]|nr:hypothetical protein AX17_002570 [Amanita inopinata Kibby_2008]